MKLEKIEPLEFQTDLHEELFCCFIAEANSTTYKMFECTNVREKMDQLINTIINEYELMYSDRNIHEAGNVI